MGSLSSMSACGHLANSSSMCLPYCQRFYSIFLVLGRLDAYDIGCQTHHAVHKWNFPLEWITHLVWGVSIFHAYGHQWACQLWYHPWKDDLWGLLDSEGCERLWSGLQHLVPGLHITGCHCHLFVLDMQLKH